MKLKPTSVKGTSIHFMIPSLGGDKIHWEPIKPLVFMSQNGILMSLHSDGKISFLSQLFHNRGPT